MAEYSHFAKCEYISKFNNVGSDRTLKVINLNHFTNIVKLSQLIKLLLLKKESTSRQFLQYIIPKIGETLMRQVYLLCKMFSLYF